METSSRLSPRRGITGFPQLGQGRHDPQPAVLAPAPSSDLDQEGPRRHRRDRGHGQAQRTGDLMAPPGTLEALRRAVVGPYCLFRGREREGYTRVSSHVARPPDHANSVLREDCIRRALSTNLGPFRSMSTPVAAGPTGTQVGHDAATVVRVQAESRGFGRFGRVVIRVEIRGYRDRGRRAYP